MKIIKLIYHMIRIVAELISRLIFGIMYYGDPHTPLPPIKNLILMEPASSLAYKIRTKKLTSEDIVKSFIARIKEINPTVNCVVDSRFDEALEEARKADTLIRSGKLDEGTLAKTKPFLGVPFSTKDCFMVKGLHQTAGHYGRKDFIAEAHADSVQLMVDAGAIPLCVTNVSELCMWWESSNTVYGRTNNPYKNSRIVGGSSGGEGCLQTSCGSPFGIGSDIGGSIRMPSFFCGIFGHKPSRGIVSNKGQEPVAVGALNDFLGTGPMCRYASDLSPMLSVLASSNVHLLKLNEKVDVKSLRYFYIEDDGGMPLITPVSSELRMAQQKVVEHLKKAYGLKAQKLQLRKLKAAIPMYFTKLASVPDATTFCQELALKKGSINVWLEFIKCVFRLSKHTAAGLFLGILEKFGNKNTPEFQKLLSDCTALRKELQEILGDDGVLFYPSHPTTAPYHCQPLFRPFNFAYTAVINILELPSTQCPLGLSKEGLPLGIQVVVNHCQDHIGIAVAQELEKAFGGWVCPSEVL